MKFSYPIRVEKEDGVYLVTFHDFPGATEGDSLEEALVNASDCLDEAIWHHINEGLSLPKPSKIKGARYVSPEPLTEIKAMLYLEMKKQKVSMPELAKRLGWQRPQAYRLTDVKHRSDLAQLDMAFHALGKRLSVEIRPVH